VIERCPTCGGKRDDEPREFVHACGCVIAPSDVFTCERAYIEGRGDVREPTWMATGGPCTGFHPTRDGAITAWRKERYRRLLEAKAEPQTSMLEMDAALKELYERRTAKTIADLMAENWGRWTLLGTHRFDDGVQEILLHADGEFCGLYITESDMCVGIDKVAPQVWEAIRSDRVPPPVEGFEERHSLKGRMGES
jgi:hypothetical protein